MRLRTILDQRNILSTKKREPPSNFRNVAHQAVKVSYKYSLGVWPDGFVNCHRINLAIIEVDIHIHWNCANCEACAGCVTSGIGYHDNLVPATNSDGSEHDFQCVRPVPQSDAVGGAAIGGEGLLKGSNRWPANEEALVQQPLPSVEQSRPRSRKAASCVIERDYKQCALVHVNFPASSDVEVRLA